ncbi:MAG TPA: thiolase domain-containing protein [Stellaceae bacterium]|nr:thiolase domain-containing protein [Stellaceae bacterium]
MRAVAVIGAGQSTYGLFPERTLKDLFFEAVQSCVADVDRGIDLRDVDEAFIGSLSTGGAQLGNLAPLMMEAGGMPGVPARHIENACASSGFAFRDAFAAIASGRARIACAAGVEKMSDLPRERNRSWLGVSGDVEWERLAGTNFPGIYAMMARRHMHEHGTTKAQITAVAVKNRGNAVANPKAQFRQAIELERALKAPNLAAPFTLADACGITDGASCILLCDAEIARDFTDQPVAVIGSGAGSDFVAVHDRPDMTTMPAVVRAAREAYAMAGLGPADIDFAEVHDCFTIGEILAYADLGFCERREAGAYVESGATRRDGARPVNNSGGLIGKGHPIGATGTGQIYEIAMQLRGRAAAPERQLRNPRHGLAHNVGGSGGSAAVHILRAVE